MPEDRFIAVKTSEMGEKVCFCNQVSHHIKVVFYKFGSGAIWKFGRRDITEGLESVDNSGKGVSVRRRRGDN